MIYFGIDSVKNPIEGHYYAFIVKGNLHIGICVMYNKDSNEALMCDLNTSETFKVPNKCVIAGGAMESANWVRSQSPYDGVGCDENLVALFKDQF